MNEREIFQQAREIGDEAAREDFLRSECGANEVLRRRIHALLESADRDDSFLKLTDTRVTTDPQSDEWIGERVGCYRLLERIGEGGFGVVYKAEQTEPVRRMVAVKILKPGMDSRQVIARFEAERQALAIMDHPNIARVFDAGATASGRPYFVMELVRGIPITMYCDQNHLTPRQRLELFIPVCQAIQHAHSKGIIHRDIKPANVMVALYDDHPVARVIDFGIAKATGQQLTELTLHTGFGAVVGSIEYMSPEQASLNQLDVDTRSDVYSLGVLLYELLTGSPPLTAAEARRAGLLESLRFIRETEPPRPSVRLSTAEGLPALATSRSMEPRRLAAAMRGELDWIVMKSLEKERNRRYATASGFAADVQRFLAGEPVEAHPPSAVYRMRKFARRHWRSLLIILPVLVGIVSYPINAERAARRRAQSLAAHVSLVSGALERAGRDLTAAVKSSIGSEVEWTAAGASRQRLLDLLSEGAVDNPTQERLSGYFEEYAAAEQDRRLAEQIEDVVIMSATHDDLDSWERMERQFRTLFRDRGMDLDTTPPEEVARRIRNDRASDELSDALELWIGTRGQMASLGGPRLTRQIMQPWADAMYAADPDPVRTGIRRLIYAGQPPEPAAVESVIRGVDRNTLSPRTLSWLGNVFVMAGAAERSDEIFRGAVRDYPGDFMLNHDYAWILVSQERWEEAIRYYMRCVAIRPDVSGTWRGLGNALRENDELIPAREALEQAVELDPKHAALRVDLAETLIRLKDFDSAESAARAALQSGSHDPHLWACLGDALYGQERDEEALAAFEQCETESAKTPRRSVDVSDRIQRCRERLNSQQRDESTQPAGSAPSR